MERAALIETIDDYLGIPVNHFVAVDFAGFQQVVSAIGGVEVYFPHPARDQGSGLFVPEAGCQLLDPAQALAYSRARHYENRIDGRWVPDRQADFGRMQRQQEFMRRALSRAIDRGARNPVTLNALLNAVDGALVLDDQLTTGQIVDIASAFRLFNPEELNSYSLQGYVSDQMIRGQSALVLHEAEADPVLDLFRGEQGLDPTPETVRLRVLNGSGAPDQAWDVAESLRAAGFGVPMTDNLRGDTISRTEIRHHPGQRASAELLARYLVTSPRLVEDRSLSFVPIELVTGTDFRGVIEPDDQSDSEGSSGSGGTASTSTSSSSSTTTPSTAPPAPMMRLRPTSPLRLPGADAALTLAPMSATIAVIGTGYVGLTTGAAFAALGHTVVCADIDEDKIRRLNDGEIPIVEDGLERLVHENVKAGRLSFVVGAAKAAAECEFSYLCVPTPRGSTGRPTCRSSRRQRPRSVPCCNPSRSWSTSRRCRSDRRGSSNGRWAAATCSWCPIPSSSAKGRRSTTS